jgi:hypothetical protein
MTLSIQCYITPSLLAKEGKGKVNTRDEELHTTPADRQHIGHPAFKERPGLCPRVAKTDTGEKWESDKNHNKTQQPLRGSVVHKYLWHNYLTLPLEASPYPLTFDI